MPEPERGWEHFEVEADVGVRAWGESRAAAFAQAALGVLALIVDPTSVTGRESREVRAQAETPEALLAAWVDECLYVHEIEGFVPRDVEVGDCTDTVVHGRLLGEPIDPARHRLGTVVKGATLHGISVSTAGARHQVRIIVDV
jgi:tRNA nucleotidyltransferase (CCA-adding enzyme)